MKTNRRGFISGLASLVAGGIGYKAYGSSLSELLAYDQSGRSNKASGGRSPFLPVHTPDLPKLPYEIKGGVKIFHLVAEPAKREFLPGYVFDVWGFNGHMPGPTIEVQEGDRVRIIFENRLPEPITVHWHGLEVPIEMDGVPGVTQPPVKPGETFVYEFTLHQNGTFFYHSHMAMQEMMGMIGFFIIHPKKPYEPRADKDFGIILQEWAILPNNTIPNSLSMEFNWLTMNGKAGPATTPLIVKLGDRVRIRFVNLGMDHHPIHLHGHQWYITGTEGGRIPETAWYPNNTVLVGVAQGRDVEFVAKYPGDWMLHCHLPHHMMNHMVSMVGPMAEMGSGMGAGMGMEAGMGMVEKGPVLSKELGPGMGRGMGLGTAREKVVSHMAGMQHPGHEEIGGHSIEERRGVPGYPQDMWMPMDEVVTRPETFGLHPGWSGAVQGMMTLVRVLPRKEYVEMMERIREGG
jgi:FtsP/CotA-like multicopper oxidase with cupredoxin domain